MKWMGQINALLVGAVAAGLWSCAEPSAREAPLTAAQQPIEKLSHLRDINSRPEPFPVFGHDRPSQPFTSTGGVALLAMFDGLRGNELWRSDGTEAGTKLIKDIAPGLASSNPVHFTEVQGVVFFSASSDFAEVGLWKTDGTAAGTVPVKHFHDGRDPDQYIAAIAPQGDKVLFIYQNQLWRSDGTAEASPHFGAASH